MKNLIERYVYDVTRRLPEKMRDDVSRELRSNIEDMLSDEPNDEEIERVLTEMGSPAKLAVGYHPKPRYLISPELFDDYMTVLKVVAVTLTALLAAIAVFKFVFSNMDGVTVGETLLAVLTSFLSGAFNGIVQSFFWVTVIFALVDYFGRKDFPSWTPKSLPEIPYNKKALIKRGDAMANLMFTILFTLVFLIGTLREPQFIAWYEIGMPPTPLFDPAIVQRFLPLYIFVLLLLTVVTAVKVLKGRWTALTAGAQMLYSLANIAVGIAFISRPGVFTDAFIAKFADKVNITAETMAGYFRTGVTVIIILMIVATIGEIATTAAKATRGDKK